MQEVRPVHDDPPGRGDRVDDRDARAGRRGRAPVPPSPAVPPPSPTAQPTRRRAASISAWLKAGLSQVGLAPLTLDRLRRPRCRPRSTTPRTPSPTPRQARWSRRAAGSGAQDNVLVRLWRRELGGVQKVFRWLNESAYFVSIPFIIILLFGTAVKNRPIALFGATFVVLLNLGPARRRRGGPASSSRSATGSMPGSSRSRPAAWPSRS